MTFEANPTAIGGAGEGASGQRHDRSVLEAAFAAARMGVWECNLPDEDLVWSDGVYDLFDLPRGVEPDRALVLDCYEPETRARLVELRSEAIRTLTGFETDARVLTARGSRRWIRITASVEARDGVPFRIFGIKRDVTAERDLLDRALHLAEHDTLTGLRNRVAFNRRLEALASAPRDVGGGTVLMLFDLDGFKGVNDGFGHVAGDEVLQAVGRRLRSACVMKGFAARIGGDEFAVLVDGTPEAVELLASEIVAAVSRPVEAAGREYRVGVSAGIARMAPNETAAALYQRADTALYRAKAAGRGTYRVCLAG